MPLSHKLSLFPPAAPPAFPLLLLARCLLLLLSREFSTIAPLFDRGIAEALRPCGGSGWRGSRHRREQRPGHRRGRRRETEANTAAAARGDQAPQEGVQVGGVVELRLDLLAVTSRNERRWIGDGRCRKHRSEEISGGDGRGWGGGGRGGAGGRGGQRQEVEEKQEEEGFQEEEQGREARRQGGRGRVDGGWWGCGGACAGASGGAGVRVRAGCVFERGRRGGGNLSGLRAGR